MALEKITKIKGRAVYLPWDDIDTDRIIPARFMKCLTFDGLGQFLFYDSIKNEDGTDKEFPLNDLRFKGASVLLAGRNFGCGSSREHAPQAIYRHGFRGIVAESFAEIFFGNATALGMPCLAAAKEDLLAIASAIDREPTLEVTLDLENKQILFGDQIVAAEMSESARVALIQGHWDPLAELLEGLDAVEKHAKTLAYMGV